MKQKEIHEGMEPFIGTGFIETRLGFFNTEIKKNHPMMKLWNEGYLSMQKEKKITWFSLTQKGRSYVRSIELEKDYTV